ncbi:hypothetical protein KM043_017665 [Ampulex compressa]|nr:hypothetical protein KM043_017665 [Ampulex compressa]
MSKTYFNSAVRFYNFLFFDLADPRTKNWFLMSSPVPGFIILCCYFYFVRSWGPRHMEHRKPYQLKNILLLYNFLQVCFSSWMFYEASDAAWLGKYSWKCEPVDYSNSPEALRIARLVHIYFLAKMSELLDTIFFVLRKKQKQITFLHLYHHTGMPIMTWCATKYFPGGHGTFLGFVNCFVHIIMYTYYLLAALLPQYEKYLWWKKYITTLQMCQFCVVVLHTMQLLIFDCGYTKLLLIVIIPNGTFLYMLFFDFYDKSYMSKKGSKSKNVTAEVQITTNVDNWKVQNGKEKAE